MKYKKIKNGFIIEVENWSSEIKVTNIKTGKLVKKSDFGDHIKAVCLAKKL